MKLVGSKTEKEIKSELLKNTSSVFSKSAESHVKTFFLDNDLDTTKVIVLDSFPDDRIVYYWLLIESRMVGRVEVELDCPECTGMDTFTLLEYRHKLSKIQQIKLAVAMELLATET
ncbi:hypothetical protein tinsulaeT_35660 [Thalassotalea insulae]|uniref:Uncharacterized protein n=1 Tax=Thalassotalea insulae TaxID=2056778 RepID=A0ABQ6H1C9_9GAMM|nr:hypothetical protein [Thalassotalea insulae]GLX80226.1 hypothetical protein tinsulaeT_35660 [Thalassotalea insulae]